MVDILAGNTSHVTYTGSANRLYSGTVTATDNGTATEIQFWCQTSCNVKVAIYDAGSATRTRLGVNNTGTACTGGQINTVSISDVVLTQGTSYNLSIISDTANFLGLAATTGGDYEYWDYGSYASGCPASYTSPTNGVFELSIAAYGTLSIIEYNDTVSTLNGAGSLSSLSAHRELSSAVGTLSGAGSLGSLEGVQVNATISTLSGVGSLSALSAHRELSSTIGTLNGAGSINSLRISDQYTDVIGTLSGIGSLNALRIAERYSDAISTLSGVGSLGILRIAERYDSNIATLNGLGAVYPLRRILSYPIKNPNPRSHAFHAEIRRGCTLADTFASLARVEDNGGTVDGGATLDRFNGLTSDGYGRVNYPADGGMTDGSIVLAFKASSGGMIAGTAFLNSGIPEDGWCIWVDGDAVYATHSDGATIATACSVAGSFLDSEWHVVTYITNLTSGNHTLYLDAEEADEQSTSLSGPLGASQLIRIGGYLHDNIVGSIRSFRLYNGTILTSSDHNAYAS